MIDLWLLSFRYTVYNTVSEKLTTDLKKILLEWTENKYVNILKNVLAC